MKLGELLEQHGWTRVEQDKGAHPKWEKDNEVLDADKALDRIYEQMRNQTTHNVKEMK